MFAFRSRVTTHIEGTGSTPDLMCKGEAIGLACKDHNDSYARSAGYLAFNMCAAHGCLKQCTPISTQAQQTVVREIEIAYVCGSEQDEPLARQFTVVRPGPTLTRTHVTHPLLSHVLRSGRPLARSQEYDSNQSHPCADSVALVKHPRRSVVPWGHAETSVVSFGGQ